MNSMKPAGRPRHEIRARAPGTTAHAFRAAVAAIDAKPGLLGEGDARTHPELAAAMVQAAAIDAAVNAGRIASREASETPLRLRPRLFGRDDHQGRLQRAASAAIDNAG